MRHLVLLVIALSSLAVLPASAVGQAGVEDAVRQSIIDSYAYGRDNLKDAPGGFSMDGSAEFWSSGGLLQWVPADAPGQSYEYNSLTPKHITVIPLADGVARGRRLRAGPSTTPRPTLSRCKRRGEDLTFHSNRERRVT